MHTYHIHIKGLVQGVGFRPMICQLAIANGLKGSVNNATDGVHIWVNGSAREIKEFYTTILNHPPVNAVITSNQIEEAPYKYFLDFNIDKSEKPGITELLLTPDIALCHECKNDIEDSKNRRYLYPFTTCLHCGPRYSITNALPYDREHTTMEPFIQCPLCKKEYGDINNRRFYSQTNSCPHCSIPIHLYSSPAHCISSDPLLIWDRLQQELRKGKTVAIKGLGGYLLICDAGNEEAIQLLRQRKHRPSKPLAVIYPSIEKTEDDLALTEEAKKALLSPQAPIVLCKLKNPVPASLCKEAIAPGLNKIGVMLPYTPILYLIATAFGKPLIATSGNLSGAPILFKDDEALNNLFSVADYILTYDRDIIAPQDDSVIQFNSHRQQIILRRSRGMAPNYFHHPFENPGLTLFSMGAELKSAFAIQDKNLVYVSQYLGDQESFDSQVAFETSREQLLGLIEASPEVILVDKHPGYYSSIRGKEWANSQNVPVISIQHHEAHFAAVMAENHLLSTREAVLGVIWDGTGYGKDNQIWGGEFFLYSDHKMERVAHINYFQQLLGDKMSREPRLAALSLLHAIPGTIDFINKYFTKKEWHYYNQLLKQPDPLQTSSMGRLLDGIACILGLKTHTSYEGEAAQLLEALAESCKEKPTSIYPLSLISRKLDWTLLFLGILQDLKKDLPKATIAWKTFKSLAAGIELVSHDLSCTKLAFSGGVFQNALLTEMIQDLMGNTHELFFHQQLSPNDECIGFGQLAHFHAISERELYSVKKEKEVESSR